MSWLTATLRLLPPRCPVASRLDHDQALECLRPGAHAEPVGYMDGPIPRGWDRIASTGRGTLVRCPGASCKECPLADLGRDVVLLKGQVRSGGVEADVAAPSREALSSTLMTLSVRGFATQVARVSRRSVDGSRRVLVDLGRLTPRQLQVLRTAVAWGFFTPGGKVTLDDLTRVMKVSRSTLHEHIQKGVSALVEDALGPPALNGDRRKAVP